MVLLFVGFLGGIFSAIAGSGVDICSFSVLSLLFRVSEKVSTPTSVVLMAINTVFGQSQTSGVIPVVRENKLVLQDSTGVR